MPDDQELDNGDTGDEWDDTDDGGEHDDADDSDSSDGDKFDWGEEVRGPSRGWPDIETR